MRRLEVRVVGVSLVSGEVVRGESTKWYLANFRILSTPFQLYKYSKPVIVMP